MRKPGRSDQMVDLATSVGIIEEELCNFFSAAQQVLRKTRVMLAHIGS
jgi:hypothetical protein